MLGIVRAFVAVRPIGVVCMRADCDCEFDAVLAVNAQGTAAVSGFVIRNLTRTNDDIRIVLA